MRTVLIQPTFEAWRDHARKLLAQGVTPDEVLWSDDVAKGELFSSDKICAEENGPVPKVPAAFLDIARTTAAHTDPRRWAALYRVLWRLTRGGERHLLSIPTDREMRQVQQWCKAIGRDIHKMHAFVRFRLVGTDEATGRDQFIAWFEPEHRIVRLAASFFQKRFAAMDWSILTPHECVHWDGTALHFTPGVPRSAAPDEDALDGLWRTYYRSIFNPARLKVKAMQAEMPKKYWKNLPEAELISELIAGSSARVAEMLETEERPGKPAPKNAYLEKLRQMTQTHRTRPQNEGREETASAGESVHHLRAPICVAEKMGARLGRSEILQRPLPHEQTGATPRDEITRRLFFVSLTSR